jgi:hypothetical protein
MTGRIRKRTAREFAAVEWAELNKRVAHVEAFEMARTAIEERLRAWVKSRPSFDIPPSVLIEMYIDTIPEPEDDPRGHAGRNLLSEYQSEKVKGAHRNRP